MCLYLWEGLLEELGAAERDAQYRAGAGRVAGGPEVGAGGGGGGARRIGRVTGHPFRTFLLILSSIIIRGYFDLGMLTLLPSRMNDSLKLHSTLLRDVP